MKVSRREWLAGALWLPALSGALSSPPSWTRPAALGNTGLMVTRLGMGCEEVKAPALVRAAAEAGINHFNLFTSAGDLTPLRVLGEALRPLRAGVVIAIDGDGQLRARRRAAGLPGEVAPRGEETGRAVLADLDAQLAALGTDYVDLWYLTSKRRPDEISDDLLDAARAAKQAGKIRALAVSTHAFAAVAPRLIELREVIGAVMVTCNAATWTDVSGDIGKLRAADVGIVAMKPLMGGLKYVPPPARPWVATLDTGAKREEALAAAVKWALHNRQIDTVPIQMRSDRELRRNLEAASTPFDRREADLLARVADRIAPVYCQNCGTCEGSCRHALPVSDMLRALMYAEGYGNLARARDQFRQATLALPAVSCASCDGCTVGCPHGVQIAERLTRARALLT